MEVQSKYKIGDYVWYINENRVLKSDVTGVGILLEEDKAPSITYTLHYDRDLDESKVFPTKEELLKSL